MKADEADMKTPWLVNWKPKRRAAVRLFCFPYAGGGDFIFRSWQRTLTDTIEVCPVQLPGRGSRITEPQPVDWRYITPDYFAVFRIRPVAGRVSQ